MRVEERSLESAGGEGCFASTIAELGLHPGVPVAFRETILVVEDDDFVRDVTCELLRESGYEVLSAESAAVARTPAGSRRTSWRRTDMALRLAIGPVALGRWALGRFSSSCRAHLCPAASCLFRYPFPAAGFAPSRPAGARPVPGTTGRGRDRRRSAV